MVYVYILLIAFGINILAALGMYAWMPEYRGYLMEEDSLIENLSAFLFLSAFFTGLIFSLKCKRTRLALMAVSAIGLLGFLDEISFGGRIFGIEMPRLFGVRIDAAHDFFLLGYKLAKSFAYSHRVFVYILMGLAALLVALLTVKYGPRLLAAIMSSVYKPVYLFALIFVAQIFSALVIDLGIFRSDVLYMLEELLEMNAALALVLCCFCLYSFKESVSRNSETHGVYLSEHQV